MDAKQTIAVSAPAKVHLLGEHTVVYGKPALLATVDLRTTVTLTPSVIARSRATKQSKQEIATLASVARSDDVETIQQIIEQIVKKELKIKFIPNYKVEISSQIPTGCHLGSSAAISAAYIAALLTFLKVRWDLNLVNKLAYEGEKVFHGSPSGGDNSTVVFGGLVWFRKETPDLKIIQKLPFSIPNKLSKNFVLINTGTPNKTTKQMIEKVSSNFKIQSEKFKKIFDNQEQLVRDLLLAIKEGNENELIQIIKLGEKNLEKIGVCSPEVKKIIRQIEKLGGAAKICGAGASEGPTGILLCYHSDPKIIKNIANYYNLSYFKTALGVEGLRKE